jgi:hypothetical protein
MAMAYSSSPSNENWQTQAVQYVERMGQVLSSPTAAAAYEEALRQAARHAGLETEALKGRQAKVPLFSGIYFTERGISLVMALAKAGALPPHPQPKPKEALSGGMVVRVPKPKPPKMHGVHDDAFRDYFDANLRRYFFSPGAGGHAHGRPVTLRGASQAMGRNGTFLSSYSRPLGGAMQPVELARLVVYMEQHLKQDFNFSRFLHAPEQWDALVVQARQESVISAGTGRAR